MDELKQFVKERDESLLSLDKDKIQSFMRKYSVPFPKNELVFWAGVHKAIIHINSASTEQKFASIVWLENHGFSCEIG